jgi:ATP-dependent exoDNAse (exonuclease V) alpha subunit
LEQRDVFVIDEAGMVGLKQLSRFVIEAERAGAKIVLVGDPEQLQPIGAGAAFRAIAERIGCVELEGAAGWLAADGIGGFWAAPHGRGTGRVCKAGGDPV